MSVNKCKIRPPPSQLTSDSRNKLQLMFFFCKVVLLMTESRTLNSPHLLQIFGHVENIWSLNARQNLLIVINQFTPLLSYCRIFLTNFGQKLGQKQTKMDRTGQKQKETDRNVEKQTESDRNGQKCTKTDKQKKRQKGIDTDINCQV